MRVRAHKEKENIDPRQELAIRHEVDRSSVAALATVRVKHLDNQMINAAKANAQRALTY